MLMSSTGSGGRRGYSERTQLPATEPVSLDEAKAFLRVSNDLDNALITRMIKASRQRCEQYLRRSLITQQWQLSFEESVPSRISLPMGPVQSIVKVEAINRNGEASAVLASHYRLLSPQDMLLFDTPIIGHVVEITYVTGFGDNASDVPELLVQGMLAHMSRMYDQRGMVELPEASLSLYAPFRQEGV